MGNYKEENNKFYRQASDGSWFEVQLNSDGNFTWTQPDGQKVKDTTIIVPHGMQKGKNPLGGTSYRVPTGANGSFGTYYNFMDAVNVYNKAYNRGAFADLSENILNDAMAGGTTLLRNGAIKGVTKGLYDNVRQIAATITQQGAKETAKKAGNILVKKVVPTVVGGVVGGTVVDTGSKALTGKTWGENVSNGLTQHYGLKVPILVGDMTNPGYTLGGKYGNFVGTNFANRGRYTLEYLTPADYKGHTKELFKLITKPFYTKPPTFHGGRKSQWYSDYAKIYGSRAAENRFQNGAIWAGIPEEEIPRTMYVRNFDGSYRLNPIGLKIKTDGTLKFPLPEGTKVGKSEKFPDMFTIGQVGGEHSNYTLKGINPNTGLKIIEFEDVQKLNPQWQFTDWIKNKFKKDSNMWNLLHKIGGLNASKIVGYKPFTIRQYYGSDGNKLYPYLDDPESLIIE